MIPITTIQGLTIQEINEAVGTRKIYIWGCNSLAKTVKISLKKSGLDVEGFLDSREYLTDKEYCHKPILHPELLIKNEDKCNIYVIISTYGYRLEAEKTCLKFGLSKNKDFISYLNISRPTAAIDISGMCNIACPSCPRGNLDDLIPDGIMKFDTYLKVFNKLKSDIPLLTKIELYSWGEPFLNPELVDIIELTEKNDVICSISTNLSCIEKLEDIILAEPSELNVTMNGFEDSYERFMQGADWKIFLNNLNYLSELLLKYNPKTLVTIKIFSEISFNVGIREKIIELFSKLQLNFTFEQGYLNPYDNLLLRYENKNISLNAKKTLEELRWNFDNIDVLLNKEKDLPCLCQRIFPIINWDLSVALCHVYYNPIIAENFLEITWEKLLEKRHNQSQCTTCQRYGLHRLDIDVLSKKYPTEIKKIYN
jgi:MoaA/NifB/PqqE/SkfB family radical SAM enzyme